MNNARLVTFVLICLFVTACGTVRSDKSPAEEANQTPDQPSVNEPATMPEPTPVEAAVVIPEAQPVIEPVVAPKRRVVKRQSYVVKREAPPVFIEPEPDGPTALSAQDIAAALAVIDEALTGFAVENVDFIAPAKLNSAETGSATLVVKNPEALNELIILLTSNEQVTKAKIQLSNRVEVDLQVEGVSAGATSPLSQVVTPSSKWVWELKSQSEGTKRLHLSMSIETIVDGQPRKHALPSVDREMVVAPAAKPAGDFLRSAWLWMLVIVLVVAIAGFWKMKQSASKA